MAIEVQIIFEKNNNFNLINVQIAILRNKWYAGAGMTTAAWVIIANKAPRSKVAPIFLPPWSYHRLFIASSLQPWVTALWANTRQLTIDWLFPTKKYTWIIFPQINTYITYQNVQTEVTQTSSLFLPFSWSPCGIVILYRRGLVSMKNSSNDAINQSVFCHAMSSNGAMVSLIHIIVELIQEIIPFTPNGSFSFLFY